MCPNIRWDRDLILGGETKKRPERSIEELLF
jgi:hypothetical protein